MPKKQKGFTSFYGVQEPVTFRGKGTLMVNFATTKKEAQKNLKKIQATEDYTFGTSGKQFLLKKHYRKI